MREYSPAVLRLIECFERLPSIGHKTAERLAFFTLQMSEKESAAFAEAILSAKQTVKYCTRCQNLTEGELCAICANETRDPSILCVVSDVRDMAAIEKTREYKGLYHILHGVISPLHQIGPDQLKIRELAHRLGTEDIKEVILATNPDTEGEATAAYIAKLIRPFELTVTRLAYGIPVGGHLEYADQVTLARAMDGRTKML